MHNERFPAAEKILTDIENIFKRDKQLNDFEILPVPVGENKSPVVYGEHTLGLQEWCVHHLYLHVYQKLMYLKQQQRLRREEPNLVSRLLLGGVLLNPDCTFLWNIRREFVVIGRFDPFFELHVNSVALSRRPKTGEAFVYRRWVLNRIIGAPLDDASASHLLTEELRVSLMAANRYANNYHAWNHRMWVMSHLPQAQNALIDEWISTEQWVSRHVSEHSGLQYRQYLSKQVIQHVRHSDLCSKLKQTLDNFFNPHHIAGVQNLSSNNSSKEKYLHSLLVDSSRGVDTPPCCPIMCEESNFVVSIGILAYELLLVTELIRLYPGHEALWCHRRFVLHSFYSLAKNILAHFAKETDVSDGVPLPKTQKMSILDTNVESSFLWQVVLSHEDQLLSECKAQPQEKCYQSRLAHRHTIWFEKSLCKQGRENFEIAMCSK